MVEWEWLEALDSEEALAWVRQQNERTLQELKADPRFETFTAEALELASSAARLPYRSIQNGFVYDLYTSPDQPLGVWRRCPVATWSRETENWENLVDLDLLSEELQNEWNFHTALISPSGNRALLSLSFRGEDRHWVREFDLQSRRFVVSGFDIPLAKSVFQWVDEDHLIVGGEVAETKNLLGYSRILRLWTRNSTEKVVLVEGQPHEFGCWIGGFPDPAGRLVLSRNFNWDECETWSFSLSEGVRRLHLPRMSKDTVIWEDLAVLQLHRDDQGFPGGSVLGVKLEEAWSEENPRLQLIWGPDGKRSGQSFCRCREGLLVSYNENVITRLSLMTRADGLWQETPQNLGRSIQISQIFTDPFQQEVYLRLEDFNVPPSVVRWTSKGTTQLASLPPQFTGDYEVRQLWAQSSDETMIPYFLVAAKGTDFQGDSPTLLYGYGGFAISLTPTYLASDGKLWLEKGGVFVMANIRGGGEFGSSWHTSARLENKQRSYDDFIAVSEDLIRRRITSPAHLAIQGGSNGGLLVGAVMLQRPDLFRAVLCAVPLLDMIRYVELPPGASWMDEYGDPCDPKMRDVILKYSPLQNIRPGSKLPRAFFMTSHTDDRVHPSHARRMAAKMQSLHQDCLFYEEMSGGHSGGNNQVKALGMALEFTYLWKQLRPVPESLSAKTH